ncbi:hypothetical protein [Anabaena azotica]|uniref:REase AHJR-like domain-containing protein n=1 Tax=Anabaena azotica FACHB-119 TaxID=947527 RepID=A0ABR8CZY8_9NOST|nr:hypothetical protein [Anabaena azotica]MBD2499642.1 hypothetical protein [Anabaena azotica FACHB-119]
MTNSNKILHDEKLKSLADKYVSEGFNVLIEPKIEQMPFDLGNYQPDIIATKDNSGLVIEIKSSPNRISVDRFHVIAEKVSQHPGWRFLLVTLEDVESKSLPGISEQLPSWQELVDRFEQAHRLIENHVEPAFLFMWSIFEGALRRRAVDLSIPVERFPTISLIKQMYSLGELSIPQFDIIQTYYEVRNSLAHGYVENLSHQVLCDFVNLVHELFIEWINEVEINQKISVIWMNIVKKEQQEQHNIKEIIASKLANLDKETQNKVISEIKQRSQEGGLETHYNEFKHLIDESLASDEDQNNPQLKRKKITFQQKAQIALDTLQAQEKESILSTIHLLQESPEHSQVKTQKLKSSPYFIANAGIYRIVFTLNTEEITIVDIVNHNRLEVLFGSIEEAKA